MAKNVLPVDFQDDILAESMNGRRKYQMITNSDGTVSFVDVTEYTQVGSNFGQAQVNATNEAVNESADKNKIIDDKDDLVANSQAGMIAGALAVKAIREELNQNLSNISANIQSDNTINILSVDLPYTFEKSGVVYIANNDSTGAILINGCWLGGFEGNVFMPVTKEMIMHERTGNIAILSYIPNKESYSLK